MSLPPHIPPEYADAMDAIADRMGRAEFEARLQLEHEMREQGGHDQNHGFFSLENKIDLYGWIRVCLKCCGLWRRVKRNYFDIQVERNEVLIPELPEAFEALRNPTTQCKVLLEPDL